MKKLFVIFIMLAFVAGYANAEWKTKKITVWDDSSCALNDTLDSGWIKCGQWDEAYLVHVADDSDDSVNIELIYWLATDTLWPANYTVTLDDSLETKTAVYDTIFAHFGMFKWLKLRARGFGSAGDSTLFSADLLLRKAVNR